jgi:hypothetical protein
VPKQQRENADLLERYEWVYGRSMGNRDEFLQRLRVRTAMEPVLEYTGHGELSGSASTGLLSNVTVRTPEHAPEQGARTSLVLETNAGEVSFELPRRCRYSCCDWVTFVRSRRSCFGVARISQQYALCWTMEHVNMTGMQPLYTCYTAEQQKVRC